MVALSSRKLKGTCTDPECPYHGSLSVRGRVLIGQVVSAKMDKTAIIRRDHLQYMPKFKRYERRHNHIPAHNPPCINAKEGDRVSIAECRPISKTVSFVIVEKLEEK
ncbi:30S ribosomal protein S17 [Candidatus Bathyarchaeota archaeon]|nr:30S ribosomal protein S17 [Candidatus Bathyarchaeota archaeon]MCK4633290.1 30S ribosomal protein S17 [Candidatus Bathyarchaeota archaeon]TET57351.1 MAG: 30S ribosomal protein S17 [Candidatus Bathyarchaeota archaeon]